MTAYINLPILFLKFWFYEAPLSLIAFFKSFNRSFLQLISLPLLVRTYFKPWKNEYRTGFIGIAIGIGVVIKTFVIAADLFLFSLVLLAEIIILLFLILWPILSIILLFKT